MKCLFFADIQDNFWTSKCFNLNNPYLVKIVNKPHLEYFIDFCSTLDITDIIIVSNYSTKDLMSYFGDGAKWGVNISYNICKPDDQIKMIILKNYSFCKNNDILLISGFFFLNYNINFLKENKEIVINELKKSSGSYLQFLPKEISFKEFIPANNVNIFDSFTISEIKNVTDYYNLSMSIISQQTNNYVLPGYNSEENLFIGYNVSYPKSVEISKPVMIGNNIKLEEYVRINKNTIIGNNTIIESLSCVKNSIIYGDTFVNSDLDLDHKIVFKNRLINGLNGTILELDDDFLISGIKKEKIISRFEHSIQLFATLIQIIFQTIPFLILIPFILLVARKSQLKRNYFINNDCLSKKIFSLDKVEDKCIVKLFKKLSLDKYPLLFKVLSGKFLLVGSSLLIANNRNNKIIRSLPYYAPSVFSYLESLHEQDNKNIDIHELYYINNKTLFWNVKIYFKILFFRLFW